MKLAISLICLILGLTMTCPAADPAAQEKPTVRFDGQVLVLAMQINQSDQVTREFIPAGEKLESWTRFAALLSYPKLNDPKAVVANLVRALKQQNPDAPSSVVENPKTGEVIVDFVTWPADNAFAEFNIFRYSKKPGGGLVAQQYALREYKDVEGFLKGLKPIRKRLVDLMAKDGLQVSK